MEPGLLSLPRTLSVLSTSQVYFTRTPGATTSNGTVNMGDGPFDGISTGAFAGASANGTILAINSTSSFSGALVTIQQGGASRFSVNSVGVIRMAAQPAGAQNAVLSLGSASFSATALGGFNGNANGTIIGCDVTNAYTGDFINLQKASASNTPNSAADVKFKVDNSGTVSFGAVLAPGISDAMTYANPMTVTVTLAEVHTVTTTSGVGNATMNASSGGVAGQRMTIIITNDAGAARTITFGTNFKTATTLVGTASKSCTISFISDGTNWYEVGRSGAATATGGM